MKKVCYVCDSDEEVVRMENKIWLCGMHRAQFAKNMRTLKEAQYDATIKMAGEELPTFPPLLAKEPTTDPIARPVVECRQCKEICHSWELDAHLVCLPCRRQTSYGEVF